MPMTRLPDIGAKNRFHKPARKQHIPIRYRKPVPEIVWTKLHVTRSINRYRFFWYRVLAPISGTSVIGIRQQLNVCVTADCLSACLYENMIRT